MPLVAAVAACQPRLDAAAPEAQLERSVESVLSRAGVMPGRIVSHSTSRGRFIVIYETDEGLRYRLEGTFEDGGPVFESVCEVSTPRCVELDGEVLWDEGPLPVSA